MTNIRASLESKEIPMKKIILFSVAACAMCIASDLNAQFTVSPNPASNNDFSFDEVDVVANSTITNDSDGPIDVSWYRTIHVLPEGWETAVCDIVQCYFPWVDSQAFQLEGGAAGNIDVHIYPDGTPGEAIVEVKMVDAANPTDTTDVFFLFNTTLSVQEQYRQNIRVYPNPTVDQLRIEAGHEIHTAEIFGTDGRLLKRVMLNGSELIDIAELPRAAYVVRLLDREGELRSSSVVVKQ